MNHRNYNKADYEYLKSKGYSESEIRKIWNRQDEPCRHNQKKPDIIGLMKKN